MRRTWLAFLVFAGCMKNDPAPVGCSRDSDCKGDRVCIAGSCVDAPAKTQAPTPNAQQNDPTPPPASPPPHARPATTPAATPNVSPAAALEANPGRFLTYGNVAISTEGILNKTSRLSQITISNSSGADAQNPSGTVTWLDDSGNTIGATSFTAIGIVAAGGGQTFGKANLSGAGIQGVARTARVQITAVKALAK